VIRLAVARTLAWTLLLASWIGLALLAGVRSPGIWQGHALLAGWLLALGLATAALARWPLPAADRRVGLLVCGCLAAAGWLAWVQSGAGAFAAAGLALSQAALVALASATVRACRAAVPRRPSPPLLPAAAGAALAWFWVGDPGDITGLAHHLAWGGAALALLLAALHPAALPDGARPGCRAALFDCSLPHAAAGLGRDPTRWPVALAALLMLPMMANLVPLLDLCGGHGLTPQASLGLHLAAMFAPAALLSLAPGGAPAWAPRLALACGPLLVAGALLPVWPGGGPGAPWAWVMALHGAAWSLAWAAQLAAPAGRLAPAPLSSRAGSARLAPLALLAPALAVLAMGLLLSGLGLAALTGLHLGVGALAALGLLAATTRWVQRHVGAHEAVAP
jgi:hypothetical protein